MGRASRLEMGPFRYTAQWSHNHAGNVLIFPIQFRYRVDALLVICSYESYPLVSALADAVGIRIRSLFGGSLHVFAPLAPFTRRRRERWQCGLGKECCPAIGSRGRLPSGNRDGA